MKIIKKTLITVVICLFLSPLVLVSCKKNEIETIPQKTTVLALNSTSETGVSGKATIEENPDHSFNIVVDLTGTPKDSTIYLDVHNGSFQDPFGKQAIDLGSIKCSGGAASTTIKNLSHITLPDLSRAYISYDSILTYKGFINLSFVKAPHQVSTSIAHVDLNR